MAIPRVVAVYTNNIPHHQSVIESLIAPAQRYSHGTWTPETIIRDLLDGSSQAFLVIDGEPIGVVITSVLTHPARRVLHIPIIAGSRFDEWKHELIALMRRFATACSCTHITAEGRRGWMKKFQEIGCREESVNMALEV